jgi:hypothetical protein
LKIQDNDNQRRLTRRNGVRSSLNGFLFLGVCLLLSGLFASDLLKIVPGIIWGVQSEGFTIIGWVGLWHPVELLLYDGIPIRQQNEIYRLVQTMEIVVRPQPET